MPHFFVSCFRSLSKPLVSPAAQRWRHWFAAISLSLPCRWEFSLPLSCVICCWISGLPLRRIPFAPRNTFPFLQSCATKPRGSHQRIFGVAICSPRFHLHQPLSTRLSRRLPESCHLPNGFEICDRSFYDRHFLSTFVGLAASLYLPRKLPPAKYFGLCFLLQNHTCLHLDCIVAGGCFPKRRRPLPAQSTISSLRQDYFAQLSSLVRLCNRIFFVSRTERIISNLCFEQSGQILGGKITKFSKQAAW